jgi:hypothetical protein
MRQYCMNRSLPNHRLTQRQFVFGDNPLRGPREGADRRHAPRIWQADCDGSGHSGGRRIGPRLTKASPGARRNSFRYFVLTGVSNVRARETAARQQIVYYRISSGSRSTPGEVQVLCSLTTSADMNRYMLDWYAAHDSDLIEVESRLLKRPQLDGFHVPLAQ